MRMTEFSQKRIALVAHDDRKEDLIKWVHLNVELLSKHVLYGTGTTGNLLKNQCLLEVNCLKSGPLGGDQQLGAMIADQALDILIFFWDPMAAQPHDVDVKALLRMSVLYNIPTACNRSTADYFISSQLFNQNYEPIKKNYDVYLNRKV
jgi:methylglyoxal synthase